MMFRFDAITGSYYEHDPKVESDEKTWNLLAGQIMVFPPYVQHGFKALTDAVIYEQQTPVRQDFLEPDFIQKLSDYLSKHQ